MSSTGKSEIMASIDGKGSNGFMTEDHDGDAHIKVRADQTGVAEEEPERQKRRND